MNRGVKWSVIFHICVFMTCSTSYWLYDTLMYSWNVCVYVCMCVCTYVCMYVCRYVQYWTWLLQSEPWLTVAPRKFSLLVVLVAIYVCKKWWGPCVMREEQNFLQQMKDSALTMELWLHRLVLRCSRVAAEPNGMKRQLHRGDKLRYTIKVKSLSGR